jgi:uncharacterized SAM-binding protein YcdF (DUF218 family)
MVGGDRLVLVTSAMHMPSSMGLCRAAGLEPVAAPVGHLVKASQGGSPARYFPSPDGLRKAQRAVHEYLGLAWNRVRGMGVSAGASGSSPDRRMSAPVGHLQERMI